MVKEIIAVCTKKSYETYTYKMQRCQSRWYIYLPLSLKGLKLHQLTMLSTSLIELHGGSSGTVCAESTKITGASSKDKGKVKQSYSIPMEAQEERRYSSYSFTTSPPDAVEWSASRLGRAFTPGERTPGTHCTGGWVGPRAGLDTEARGKILLSLCRGSNLDLSIVQSVARHYTD
jgi:hypothetical protein